MKMLVVACAAIICASGLCLAADDTDKAKQLPLSKQLLHCTVRIEVKTDTGTGVGTGFFYKFLREGDGRHVPAIVTCKHVVKGAKQGTFHLTVRGANSLPELGNHLPIVLDQFEARWISHPDPNVDLCVMPIAPLLIEAKQKGKDFFYISLDETLLPSEKALADLGPLQDIVFIGYPIGVWDAKNNLPVARQGVLATDPIVDYNGTKQFMIDAACWPGSSGSPVFVFNEGSYTTRSSIVMGDRLQFLGVLYGGPEYTAEGQVVIKNIPMRLEPRMLTKIPSNLGLVIKADLLSGFDKLLRDLIAKQGTPSGK